MSDISRNEWSTKALDWYDEHSSNDEITRDSLHLFMLESFDLSEKQLIDLQDEIDRATLYATELAISLHQKLYADVTQWEPLPDLYGLLSQIDNMICGIKRGG